MFRAINASSQGQNDPFRAGVASLHAGNGMEWPQNASSHSRDGMESSQNDSLYAENGMERPQNGSLHSKDGMDFIENGSSCGQAKRYDSGRVRKADQKVEASPATFRMV